MAHPIYIGRYPDGITRTIFRSPVEPSPQATPQYASAWGPFRTMRGARFAIAHGRNNPHVQNVRDAERIAKVHATEPCACHGAAS